jgi:ankyrin repeat protein
MGSSRAIITAALVLLAPATTAAQRIHRLVHDGDVARLERLLSCDGDLVHATDASGATPLHIASLEGHGAAVTLLLTRGAAPNATDARGLTPLHLAAVRLHVDIVGELLARGADPMARRESGSPSPTDLAFLAEAYRGGTAVTRALLTAGGSLIADGQPGLPATRLLIAELAGNSDMVELLTRQAVSVSATTP